MAQNFASQRGGNQSLIAYYFLARCQLKSSRLSYSKLYDYSCLPPQNSAFPHILNQHCFAFSFAKTQSLLPTAKTSACRHKKSLMANRHEASTFNGREGGIRTHGGY